MASPVVPEHTADDLYENAPCGYLSTLPGGLITRVNQTLLTWTGYRRDELVMRRRFQDILTPGDRIFHETHYSPLLHMQGTVREIAVEVVRADGQRMPALVNAVLDRDEYGTPMGTRVVVFDATARRRYERELLHQRRVAELSEARVRVLQGLTAALAAARDAEQIAAVVVDELTPHLALDGAVLALVDEDTGALVAVGAEADRDLGTEATGAASRRTAVFTGPAPGADMPGTAALPLISGGRVLGVLRLDFPAGREFDAEEREFLVAFAGQCAQAVERARLHAQTVVAAARAATLADVSRSLDEVRSFTARAQRLVESLVPALADCAVVEIATGHDLVRVAAGPAAEVVGGELLEAGGPPPVVEPGEAVARALATGEPELGPEPGTPPGLPLLGASARSYVVLPLRTRGRTVGALTLACTGSGRRFREADLPFLTDLAYRAALALENVWVFEQERNVAQTLQHSMLAGTPPEDARFAVATHYRPAVENLEVGGDWYDTFLVTDGVLGVVVGDVVGRGIVAASAMGQLRSAIRALAGTGVGPAAVLRHLDSYVEHVESAAMATVVYAEVTLGTGSMRYACAGHLPPLLAGPHGPPQALWEGRSAPLGAQVGLPERTEAEVVLEPGSRLLLYTDGLVERRDRTIIAGLDRLAERMGARRDEPVATLVDGLSREMLADEDRRDDVCLLCLAYS